jgi:acyl-coenzyme A thioesterase PaaI-like protein
VTDQQTRVTPTDALPVHLCGACRRIGACRMGLESESIDADGLVSYRLRCEREHEGGLNVAHGGWTAGVLDEIVGHVAVLHGQLAVTGQLDVTFVKPVPVEQPLLAEAWRERKQGSRWFVEAVLRLEASGAELATARAILVERDAGHFARHEQWLAGQLAEGGHGAA